MVVCRYSDPNGYAVLSVDRARSTLWHSSHGALDQYRKIQARIQPSIHCYFRSTIMRWGKHKFKFSQVGPAHIGSPRKVTRFNSAFEWFKVA